jgi:tetratricopeptide (TPR) repeat protein
MKAKTFLILPVFIVGGTAFSALAQTDSNPPMTNVVTAPKPHVVDVPQPAQPGATTPGADETDPAKIADFKERFKQGNALQDAGRLIEARKIYDGILAEDPNARGSLFEAGETSMRLGEMAKADVYLSRLHELEPNFAPAIELLIQVNQALKRDVKVELLIRDFAALRQSGNAPDLAASLCFVRERVDLGQQVVVISQFFDYMQDPNTVWMAEVFDPGGQLKRRLLLNYDAAATQALRAKDASLANAQVFTWFEHVIKSGQVTGVNAYLQIFALPDYQKFRSAMFVILANPPKPIYSAPVDATQH